MKQSKDLPSPQESNAQLLNDIQALQDIEKQLFMNLEENTNLTSDEKKKIIDKINNISKMRVNLYQTLNGVNSFYQNALEKSKSTLKEQSAAIDIVEKELNMAKKRLQTMEEERNNKIRMVEINNYYGERYAEHASLMKIIIIMLVPVLLLTILRNQGFLPIEVYFVLIVIIGVIGGVNILKTLRSIALRDAMNYDEYDFTFNPQDAPKSVGQDDSDPWSKPSSTTELVFDASSNMCVAPKSTASSLAATPVNPGQPVKKTLESFVNDIFTKSSTLTTSKKPDVTLESSKVEDYNGSSFLYK